MSVSALVDLRRIDKKPHAAAARRALSEAGRPAVHPLEFRSQFGEDALIWMLCGRQLDGFFIEVGAFDGYNYSATYALECLGWTGLLVEAIPERADECRTRRPHSRVVHAALGDTHGGTTSFTVTDDDHGGMFSYTPDALREKHKTAARTRQVTVPLTTMNELLREHRGEIDVAVIDVEGSELSLLTGFDLQAWRPKMLLIEDNVRTDTALADYMAGLPYMQVAWLRVNRVYVRDDLAADWRPRLE